MSKIWEIVKDREAWRAAVQGVTKSQTRLNANKKLTRRYTQALSIQFNAFFICEHTSIQIKFPQQGVDNCQHS